MAYGGNICVVPGGDVYSALASGTINEGRLVEFLTTTSNYDIDQIQVTQASANSNIVMGYVEDTYESGDRVRIRSGGIARLTDSGSGITRGDRIAPDSNGTIKTFASGVGGACVGFALETISASALGKVFVDIDRNTNV